MKKFVILSILTFALASSLCALGPLTVTVDQPNVQIPFGQSGTAKVTVTNTLVKQPALNLTFTANYTMSGATLLMSSTAPFVVQPVNPLVVNTIALNLPVGWSLINPPTFGQTLFEGQSMVYTFTFSGGVL